MCYYHTQAIYINILTHVYINGQISYTWVNMINVYG
jgi:hypothetical protein